MNAIDMEMMFIHINYELAISGLYFPKAQMFGFYLDIEVRREKKRNCIILELLSFCFSQTVIKQPH